MPNAAGAAIREGVPSRGASTPTRPDQVSGELHGAIIVPADCMDAARRRATASPMRSGPLSYRRPTAASFLARAHAWYTSAGITIERSGALEGSAGSSAEAVNVAPWLSVSIWVQRDWNEALRSSGPCNKQHAS